MRRVICCLVLFLLAGCGSSEFVPADLEIPAGLEAAGFRLRPITVADAEKDYEALMESIGLSRAALLNHGWPMGSFTLEQNRHDLAKKERRFERRPSSGWSCRIHYW